jgi:hypothetical protein
MAAHPEGAKQRFLQISTVVPESKKRRHTRIDLGFPKDSSRASRFWLWAPKEIVPAGRYRPHSFHASNGGSVFKLVVAVGVVTALSGCAGGTANPQTRAEYVQNHVIGVPFSMMDTHTSNRSFEQVVQSLRQKSEECFNSTVTTSRTEGGVKTMNVRDKFRTTVRVLSAGKAELTTQYTSTGIIYLQKIPDGGFYHRAVDITRVSSSSTKLTYYGSKFESSKLAWAAIQQWSDGKAAACP